MAQLEEILPLERAQKPELHEPIERIHQLLQPARVVRLSSQTFVPAERKARMNALEPGIVFPTRRGCECALALQFPEEDLARQEAELLALPLFADRLQGRAALASGDPAGAIEPLTRARDGFASLGARWEAAVSALSLGEAFVAAGDPERARPELASALTVFDELGSVREIARARSALNG